MSCTENIYFLNDYFVNRVTVLQLSNYWICSIIHNSIFIAQESSRYLVLKNIYSLHKKDCFFAFCVYKNVSQKIFLHKNENHNDSNQQKTTCTFSRNFSRSKTICVTFLLTKSHTLYATQFLINV